jgi:hypothetical protein
MTNTGDIVQDSTRMIEFMSTMLFDSIFRGPVTVEDWHAQDFVNAYLRKSNAARLAGGASKRTGKVTTS